MRPPVSSRPTITCLGPKKTNVLGSSCLLWGSWWGIYAYHSPTHAQSLSLMKQREKFFCLPADVKAPTHPDGAVPYLHQAQCISKYFDGLKYEGMLFSKTTPCPFLFFYLFLTVCHPVIGGNPSCIAWAFIFCWPRNNTKLSAGFPAARRKGLFSLFKYYLPWKPWSCAQALYCIFPASISACTLKVFRFHVLCSLCYGRSLMTSEKKRNPIQLLPLSQFSPLIPLPHSITQVTEVPVHPKSMQTHLVP